MKNQNFAQNIVNGLGGVSAASKFFGIKMPSVCEWLKENKIPKARIRHLQDVRPDLFPTPPAPEKE